MRLATPGVLHTYLPQDTAAGGLSSHSTNCLVPKFSVLLTEVASWQNFNITIESNKSFPPKLPIFHSSGNHHDTNLKKPHKSWIELATKNTLPKSYPPGKLIGNWPIIDYQQSSIAGRRAKIIIIPFKYVFWIRMNNHALFRASKS